MRAIKFSIMLLISFVLLTACQEDAIIPVPGVQSPTVAGESLSVNLSTGVLSFHYTQKPSDPNIVLNGEEIAYAFDFEAKPAIAKLSKLSDFLIQGNNTVQSNPANDGAKLTFFLDNKGPEVTVQKVDCTLANCSDKNNQYTVTGRIRDASNIDSLEVKVYQYDANTEAPFGREDSEGFPMAEKGQLLDRQPAIINGENFNVAFASGGLYEFHATDALGKTSVLSYLADGSVINPIFKVRFDNSAFESLKPLFNKALTDLDIQAIDETAENFNAGLRSQTIRQEGDASEHESTAASIQCALNQRTWNPAGVYGDKVNEMKKNCSFDGKEGKTVYLHIGEFVTDNSYFESIGTSASKEDNLNINMNIADNDDGNSWGTKVKIRASVYECKHDLYLKDYWKDGWLIQQFHYTRGIKCSWSNNDGLISLLYNGGNQADGYEYATIYINDTTLNGDIAIKVDDGALSTDIGSAKLTLKGLKGDGFVGSLITLLPPGLLELIVKPIIQGTLNNALQEFKLPIAIVSEDTGANFSLTPQAFQVYTKTGNGVAEPGLYMYYSGNFDTNEQSIIDAGFSPDQIATVLGSVYRNEELPEPKNSENGSNLEVAVSSNFINQGLLAIYKIGMTHIHVLNNKTYFGPTATDDLGANGNTRITLTPSGPGSLYFAGDRGTEARFGYNSAELAFETKKEGQWKTNYSVNVDIELGALIAATGDKVTFTFLKDPRIEVNEIVNNTWLPIGERTVEALLNVMFGVVIPAITENALVLTLPSIEAGGTDISVTTKSIESANGAHLHFANEIKSD